MTGGQYSPTTPYGSKTTTCASGHIEHAFSISELAVTAGATYVARGTVYHVHLLDKLIQKAINRTGFSVVEVMSNCHIQYGRRNNMSDPVTMLSWFRDHAVTVERAAKLSEEEKQGKFTIGTLVDCEKPNYIESYEKIRANAKGET